MTVEELCEFCTNNADAAGNEYREAVYRQFPALVQRLKDIECDLAHWVQLAKYQRDWFTLNHPDKNNAGPCPTDIGIAQSEKLLGREIGYPNSNC